MANEIYEAFINLFQNLGLVMVIFMLTGLVLIAVEFFHSSNHSIIGIMGAILIAAGIIVRMLAGGTLAMLMVMIFLNTTLIFVVHILSMTLKKRNWILYSLHLAQDGKEGIVRDGTFDYLINTVALATTDINPLGSISADNASFVVYADEHIKKGELVRIIEADYDKITVRKFRKGEEDEPEFLTRI